MFFGVILSNMVVVILVFCGGVRLYDVLTHLSQGMNAVDFADALLTAGTPLFMAAGLYMLIQIACQVQRTNIELKMKAAATVSVAGPSTPPASSPKPPKKQQAEEKAASFFDLDEKDLRRGPGCAPRQVTPPLARNARPHGQDAADSSPQAESTESGDKGAAASAESSAPVDSSASAASADSAESSASAVSAVSSASAVSAVSSTPAASPASAAPDRSAAPSPAAQRKDTGKFFSLD